MKGILNYETSTCIHHCLVVASSVSLALPQAAGFVRSAAPPFPTESLILWGPHVRSHVLVVCGNAVTESMKNDIAIAERRHITATTLDGILTVKGQGRNADEE